jgi:hypothetical protein
MGRVRQAPETGIRTRHPLDAFWWVAAGTLTWAAARIPDLLYPERQGIPQLVSHALLFLVGALVGAFRSYRPWRWGVAAFLALALVGIGRLDSGFQITGISLDYVWAQCKAGAAEWALRSLRVLVGAYIGALLVNRGLA